jgi:hypothetical protein
MFACEHGFVGDGLCSVRGLLVCKQCPALNTGGLDSALSAGGVSWMSPSPRSAVQCGAVHCQAPRCRALRRTARHRSGLCCTAFAMPALCSLCYTARHHTVAQDTRCAGGFAVGRGGAGGEMCMSTVQKRFQGALLGRCAYRAFLVVSCPANCMPPPPLGQGNLWTSVDLPNPESSSTRHPPERDCTHGCPKPHLPGKLSRVPHN